jgi:CheY-like chemotaxis protein
VKDTGIGIEKEFHKKVFQSFKQADSSSTREYGGTGLGLAISKKLVEVLGGEIWLESKPGKGSQFQFKCPLKLQPAAQQITGSDFSLKDRTILVGDYNQNSGKYLSQRLQHMGAAVTLLDSCKQAVGLVKKAIETGNPFDIVLLDCRLNSEEDNFSTLETIKHIADSTAGLIAMMTPIDFGVGAKKLEEIGILSYLIKPVKQQHLVFNIKRTLGTQVLLKDTAPSHSIEIVAPAIPLNILLVDDSHDNRLLVELYLAKTIHHLASAENGKVAVDMFKNKNYNLVLMDIHMPIMDGHAATKEIRKWEQQQGRAPAHIIALTANAMKEDEQKSLKVGCNTHLTKPINKLTLLNTINQLSQAIDKQQNQGA